MMAVLYLAQRFSTNIVVQIAAARLKSHFFIKLSGAEIFLKDPQEYIVKSQMLQFIHCGAEQGLAIPLPGIFG